MSDLAERNFAAVAQALRSLEERLAAAHDARVAADAKIASLAAEVLALRQQVVMMAVNRGRGPTT